MLRFQKPASGFTTRFAPAPTGLLHLGHVANAILVFGLARVFSGKVLLRIEDHDRTRSRSEFEAAIHEDLRWLGFDETVSATRQSDRESLYAAALEKLENAGLIYACACSRKSLEASVGETGGESAYPGICRDAHVDGAVHLARRVRLDPAAIGFDDLRLGRIEQTPSLQCGDVLVRDRLSQWTYQFAVSVDDLDQDIDLVIRGEDLLESTGRQIQLATLLGRAAPPRFLHHALLRNPDGQKLSKSKGDTGVRELRSLGWPPSRVLGAVGVALGLSEGEPLTFDETAKRVFAAANA